MEVGKTYTTTGGHTVEIYGTNSLGEFRGAVSTGKKKNFGHDAKEQCLWKPDGTCCWPDFPEYNIVL